MLQPIHPGEPGGEGWLVTAEQQLLGQFKADSARVDAQLVQEMAIDQAKAAGAVAMFGEKYAD